MFSSGMLKVPFCGSGIIRACSFGQVEMRDMPGKNLYDAMRESIITLDGTRPYIPSSSGFRKPAGRMEGFMA